MVLPFLERLGHDLPAWDFRVPGVTAMTCDLHKYGFVPKGASVVLHSTGDWTEHQAFFYADWPSGIYWSPAVAGAKSPAAVMTAWAFQQYLGEDGYTALVSDTMATVDRIRSGVAAIGGIDVVGDPVGTILAFRSDVHDLFAVGEEMDRRGWFLNRNTEPEGLHMMVSPGHGAVVGQLLEDLRESVAVAGTAASRDARYA